MDFINITNTADHHMDVKISRLSWHGNKSLISVKNGIVSIPNKDISVKDLNGNDWIPNKLNSKSLYTCSYKCGVDTKATLYFHSNTIVEVRCIECDGVQHYDVLDVLNKETNLHHILVKAIKDYYNNLKKGEE